MQFNSLLFVGFFLGVLGLYHLLQGHYKVQNWLLLAASWIFYGYWDWRFLGLLVFSSVVDYAMGRAIDATAHPGRRRLFLILSITSSLTILGFFKYFNFFAANFARVLALFNLDASFTTLHIVLPVGISFYTFQTMSYTIDVYKRELKATRSFIDFALFVGFIPQLVAGPIERAVHLLPQMQGPRRILAAQMNAGVYLLLWGYFKKVVIADNAGILADHLFNHYTQYRGLELAVGTLAFAVQIYCDFSGYSDIARGLAKVMGFEVMVNFKLPYFATSPSDFWQRWHVSLSTWLRDYLYVPLGGNRGGEWKTYRNLALTMLLGGLWHGAAWNFVAWGAFHGAILILYRLWDRRGRRAPSDCGVPVFLVRMALMFCLTQIGWILFRCRSWGQIQFFFQHLFRGGVSSEALHWGVFLGVLSIPLVLMEVWQYRSRDLLAPTKLPLFPRTVLYGALLTGILLLGVRAAPEFIYFQF